MVCMVCRREEEKRAGSKTCCLMNEMCEALRIRLCGGGNGDDDHCSTSGRICLGTTVILDGMGWDRLRFVEMRGFEIGEEEGRGDAAVD